MLVIADMEYRGLLVNSATMHPKVQRPQGPGPHPEFLTSLPMIGL